MSADQSPTTRCPDCADRMWRRCQEQGCVEGADKASRPEPGSARHAAALRAAAFALFPIMDREGMGAIERASAGELAHAAVTEYERVMQGGDIHV